MPFRNYRVVWLICFLYDEVRLLIVNVLYHLDQFQRELEHLEKDHIHLFSFTKMNCLPFNSQSLNFHPGG
jgi:hypothetical protein